ncbi:MAG: substrate-binding domain-containing protein [Thermoanaerobacterales bacterium]|nr:substrate-binding domain-containing protein [Thermoanaerobacterales bacterium]
MPRKWFGLLAVLIVAGLLLAPGCGQKKAERKPAEKKPRIAFALADMRRDGNQAVRKAVDEAAKRDGNRITWLDAKGDPLQQERDIEKLLKQKVDVAVIQFADPAGGGPLVRRLATGKVRVIALENLPPDTPVDGFITSDHRLAGQLQARFVIQRLGAGTSGRVLILQGDPADPMAQQITESARTYLEQNSAFTVEVKSHPRWDPKAAAATLEQALDAGPPAAVLANESRMAMAAVEVLRTRGLHGEVLTAGVGADRTAAEALVAGQHDAEVDVQPDMLGRFAYDAAVSTARDRRWNYDTQTVNGNYSIPTRIIPVRLVDSENAFLLEERLGQAPKGGRGQGGSQSGGGSSSGSSGGGAGGGGQGGQQQQQKKKTRLIITTQDGKTMEMEIDGEVKKIEARPTGAAAAGGGGQGGGT